MSILNWILHMSIIDALYLIAGISVVGWIICSIVGIIKVIKEKNADENFLI